MDDVIIGNLKVIGETFAKLKNDLNFGSKKKVDCQRLMEKIVSEVPWKNMHYGSGPL